MSRIAILALCLLAVSASSFAWWNADWSWRKAVTLDTTPAGANIPTDLRDTPVLLRLHMGNFTHFLDLAQAGADISLVAGDDQTPLAHHIEHLDVVNELAFIWVKLPTIKGNAGPAPIGEQEAADAPADGSNKLYLYFGNPKATQGGPASATYGAGTALVYHFDDVSGVPGDRGPLALPPPSFTGQPNPASLIGAGARFAGNGQLKIADAPPLTLNPASGWGFQTWVKIDASQSNAFLLDRQSGSQRLSLVLNGTAAKLQYRAADGSDHETTEAALTPAAWHHLAITSQNGTFTLYLDGAAVGNFTAPAEALAGDLSVGAALDGSGGLTGDVDELRVYNVAPTADAIRFAAVTEGVEVKGLTYLADESADTEGAGEAGGGHSSYFGIILNQVFGNDQAIIEQAVIGICAVMALIAFAVMILKQVYLMRCRAATARFLDAYEELGVEGEGGLDSLYDGGGAYAQSPVFRIYRQGINEIRRRTQQGAAVQVNQRALVAIRAALDAVMIREGQRLNAQMVLLTIAISGGPFIGLLGTVVGVMVTFAAIAASGDVNINAIAPGMAAALLATTAGLAVAIPSLFGYNYLGSKVKELSADMHVFADEFLARINELYGE